MTSSFDPQTAPRNPQPLTINHRPSTHHSSIRLILITCLIILLSQPAASSADTRISLLYGDDYFPAVNELLCSAQSSIVVAMYFIIMDPKSPENLVPVLVKDLTDAAKRGVEVRVILEDSKVSENLYAAKVLRANGVRVDFDTPSALMHLKVVVIDREVVVIGSHNWSESSLTRNTEASIVIRDKETATEILAGIKELKTQAVIALPITADDTVPVPAWFILNPEAGRKLVKNRAELKYNLYLLLLRDMKLNDNKSIKIDYIALCGNLGVSGESCRDRLRKPLKALERDYKLLKYDSKNNTAVIAQLDTKKVFDRQPDEIYLPLKYWEYGLNKRLSLRAGYLYLISLFEARMSTKNPYWFRSQEDMSEIYGLSEYTISLALMELERENIIEVDRDISDGVDFSNRKSNTYNINPLISDETFKTKLRDLKQKHGEKITEQAVELSSHLNEPKDLEDIETFINLIKEYGIEKVKQANKKTASTKKGSGLRHISNTIHLLSKK